MRPVLRTLAVLLACAPISSQAPVAMPESPGPSALADRLRFRPPVRLTAAGRTIRIEHPGYASPCLFDVNGDGREDLVVGQFAGGRIRVHPAGADGFGAGRWLEVNGRPAEIPGIS